MWQPKIGTNVTKLYEDKNKVQRDSFFQEMYEDKSMEGTDEIIDEAEDEDESKPISVGSKEGRTIVDAATKVLGGLGKNKKVGAAAVKTAVQNNGDEDIEEIEDPEDLEEAGIMVAGKAISQEQKNDVLRLFAAMGMEPVDGMIEIIRIAASMIDEIKQGIDIRRVKKKMSAGEYEEGEEYDETDDKCDDIEDKSTDEETVDDIEDPEEVKEAGFGSKGIGAKASDTGLPKKIKYKTAGSISADELAAWKEKYGIK